jgi:signal transduction histidine kinase
MTTGLADKMRLHGSWRGWLTALAVAGTLSNWAFGQGSSNWRVYKVADGLPESTCISVTLGPHGKMLVRHLGVSSVSVLDGYGVTVIPGPEDGSNGRGYEGPGGRLWTVAREGLQEFTGDRWVLHPVPEISAALKAAVPRPIDPVPLCPLRKRLVVFLLPDVLWGFDAEDPDHLATRVLGRAANTHLGRFLSLTPALNGGLWVTGERGLAKVPAPARPPKPETEWEELLPPASLGISALQEVHEEKGGSLTVLAESAATHQKVAAYFDGEHWSVQAAGPERIRHAWRGFDGAWWATTADALLQWDARRMEMVENEEIWANHYYDLATEPGGAFWLATSEGLFRCAPLAWRTPSAARGINSPVHCLAGDKKGTLWFATASGLNSLLDAELEEHPFPTDRQRSLEATRALYTLADGAILLEAPNQLFRFDPAKGTFETLGGAGASTGLKVLGALQDGSVCVEREAPDSTERRYELQRYDGNRFQLLSNQLPNASILALRCLFVARNGDWWIGAERGVAWFHDQKWQVFASPRNNAPEAATRFAESTDGKIWCAAQDRVWQFDGRDWFAVRSGFDRINGMIRTQDGSIWVASNRGAYRFFQGAWVENGAPEGLAGEGIRQVYEDQGGRIWAATTRGLSQYHPDTDGDPPEAYISKEPEAGNKFREGKSVVLTFGGRDKWQATARERLLYSYRLDDRDWSAFSEATTVAFDDLPAGKHYFQVRAMDRNCNITGQGATDPKPAQMEFLVVLPWYKETRLMLVSAAALCVAVFFAGLALNRHVQLVRGYAAIERKIEERTRELEVANKELLHSQKMTALGTLAAGVAHDFNNILSIIKGSAQIIEDNLDNPRKVSARVDRIKTVVDQGAGIVKAMLGFGRETEDQPGSCDLNTVVDDTVKLLGDRFLREVRVSFEPAPGLPAVAAPRDFIQQILLNFVFNAAESMTANKHVMLRTSRMGRLPGALTLAPGQAAEHVAVAVQDTGCGIPPENMPRIFEPFFTTKALSARRGTGLGLSMVYELARKMEAGLAVESIPGRGSTFTLILPVRPEPAKPQAKAPEKVKVSL